MSHLERNLALLARRQPHLAGLLRNVPLTRIRLAAARNGMPICSCQHPGEKPVALHSRYDPLLEARKNVEAIDLAGADYFVILGLGLGYLLDALLECTDQEKARVFVVEPDLEILRAALEARDLTTCLSLPHIHFAWPAEGDGLARQWQEFFDPVSAQRSVYISHESLLAQNPPLFKSAAEIIQSRTLQIFTDINTMIGSSLAFLENFVANFHRIAVMPGVRHFAGRFAGVPCVLVSAGPSLDRNIHDLRAYQDRVLILAADTALKPLLAAGIDPAFVMTADPRHENYLHLKGAASRKAWLVAEPTAYPDSLEEFAGRAVACVFEGSSLATFSEIWAGKGKLRAWGSVATMCLDFALLLGCDPVIFVGQDLAFSGGRTYCSGLHWESAWFAGVRTPEEWQSRWAAIRTHNKIVMAEDIFGRQVASTDRLLSYWNWITAEVEKHPEVTFINATEGGILKNRVRVMSLKEALHRFCPGTPLPSLDVPALLENASVEDRGADMALLEEIRQEALKIPSILEKGLRLDCPESARMPSQDLIRRCERVKNEVRALKRLAPVLDCFNQMGNVAFLRARAAQSGRPVSSREILDVYLEYFRSVKRAAQPVEEALSRLLPD